MSRKIFLAAGETSGDLHASRLAREIKKIDPGISLIGIGGANMASAGVSLFYRTDELAIIGLFDVFKHLKKIKEVFFSFLAKVKEEKADLVILVDYPGFNLRLAKELKKIGIKVLYYVSPQVWAWGKWRIKRIKKHVDKMIVLFEFEADIYRKAGIPVEFVGHPLVDTAKPSSDRDTIIKNAGLDKAKKTVVLLPGSREREITALLPTMVKALQRLYNKSRDIQFIVIRSPNLGEELFDRYIKELEVPVRMVVNRGNALYDYLFISDLAIVASGSVTLECTMMNVPMIVTYKISLFNAIIMRLFMRISTIGMVNILAGRRIVPELVQFDFTAKNVFRKAAEILFESDRNDWIKKELAKVRKSLGEEGASRRAALSVLNFLEVLEGRFSPQTQTCPSSEPRPVPPSL